MAISRVRSFRLPPRAVVASAGGAAASPVVGLSPVAPLVGLSLVLPVLEVMAVAGQVVLVSRQRVL